jgi:SMC interacting uncharacterized protein involved in chromosome segregation
MDPIRELDQIRDDIDKLHDRTNSTKVKIAALEAIEKERYEHLLTALETLKKDMEELTASVRALQSLATEGKTSLRTLLWVGGVVAALTSFILMLYSYVPK